MSRMAMKAWAKGPEYKPALSERLAKHGWRWILYPDGTGTLKSNTETVAQYDLITREYRILPGFSNNTKWTYFQSNLSELMKLVEETVEGYGHGVRKEAV